MICKHCNTPIEDGSLICNNCGFEGPLNDARAEINALYEKRSRQPAAVCRSPLFLAFTICLSIISLINAYSVMCGGVGGILPTVFMAISAVNLWLCYCNKDVRSIAPAIRNASLYDAFERVMQIISMVMTLVFTIVPVAIFIIAGKDAIKNSLPVDGATFDTLSGVIIFAALLIGGASALILWLISRIYMRRRRFFLALATYAETGKFDEVKLPMVSSCVIGVAIIAGGVSSLAMVTMSDTILGIIAPVMDNLSSLGEIAGILEAALATAFGGMLIDGIGKIALGAYYVLSAMWMASTQNEVVTLRSDIDHTNVRRLELERSTKAERDRRAATYQANAEASVNYAPTQNEEVDAEPSVSTQNEEAAAEPSVPTQNEEVVAEPSAPSHNEEVAAEPSVFSQNEKVAAEPSVPTQNEEVDAEPSVPTQNEEAAAEPSAPTQNEAVVAEPSDPSQNEAEATE